MPWGRCAAEWSDIEGALRSDVGAAYFGDTVWQRGQMGCLYNREEHVLTVVLGRKEVLAPAAQLVRCARPALRLGLQLVAASSLRLRLPAWAVVGTSR